MSSRTAVDSEGSWFDPERVADLRRHLPITYVDVVPVRTDVDGAVAEVGLLLRASGAGQIVRAIVSGRVLIHETLREAIARHVEKDLGPMAMPRIPVTPVPFTVAEYFPTPGVSPSTTRASTRSRWPTWSRSTGDRPQEDALGCPGSAWTSCSASPPPLTEMDGGRDLLIRRASPTWAPPEARPPCPGRASPPESRPSEPGPPRPRIPSAASGPLLLRDSGPDAAR